MSSLAISLELLEAHQGHPVQSWEFASDETVVIGRARESNVVIGNPYVSRTHACLRVNDGRWELSSTSSHGVIVDGRRRDFVVISDGTEFRLGGQGPWIRIRWKTSESDEESQTITFDPVRTPLLVLDPDQLADEVEEITEGDFFERLTELATRLKKSSDP
ncbi:MAG: FHA domain-containing protein [Planctomycetota bacterium]|nr:FHA domain-containing protein [Planctomycetota bacterium]